MIPKAMESLPLNPFSTFSQQPGSDKYTVSNPMSGNDFHIPSYGQFDQYLERKTANHQDDKIYSTTHFGGSGVSHNSFRRYTHTQNTYTGKSNNSYDMKSRKIV
jgi:hypothetical protein